jgi:adenylate cyclase
MKIGKLKIAACVAAASLLTCLVLSGLSAVKSLEDESIDIREIAFAPETKASADVVMVWLDEATMKALPYRSPVPRDFLAGLTDQISKAGPRLIAYDIFFKGASFKEADESLADSLARSKAYAVMPMRACKEKGSNGCVDMPDKLFSDALIGVGLADLPFSAYDSTVRRAKFSFDTDAGKIPSFAGLIYKAFTGRDAPAGETIIRFAGPPGRAGGKDNAFRIYPAHLVAKGLIPLDWLKDKIVLVGAAYDDATDAYLTPYYSRSFGFKRMNGVEIHANILSSLITGQFYSEFVPWQKAILSIVIAIVSCLASLYLAPWKSAVALAVVVSLDVAASIAMFKAAAVVMPIVLPVASSLASYSIGIGTRAFTEGRQKRFIKGVFAKYVPPAVVERIVKNPGALRLGGERRMVTSMFTDIASFTTISERLDAETLVSFLNEYLGRMNDVLFKYDATLDKYEGDAIIAFFGAPLDVASHGEKAVRAAIEMQKACDEISSKWKGICGTDITTRIGINTGPAVVGNMGSEGRFDYTAIGDTVNLASRLEGTNKLYGTKIVCSEGTVAELGEEIIRRPLDIIRVKGKGEAITIYEIMGLPSDLDQAIVEGLVTPYKSAFAAFIGRQHASALGILGEIAKAHPSDEPTRMLISRCERLIREPSWDLVTDLLEK